MKKLWNMKMTLISIGAGALETISKNLENRLKELEIIWRIVHSYDQLEYFEIFWIPGDKKTSM